MERQRVRVPRTDLRRTIIPTCGVSVRSVYAMAPWFPMGRFRWRGVEGKARLYGGNIWNLFVRVAKR